MKRREIGERNNISKKAEVKGRQSYETASDSQKRGKILREKKSWSTIRRKLKGGGRTKKKGRQPSKAKRNAKGQGCGSWGKRELPIQQKSKKGGEARKKKSKNGGRHNVGRKGGGGVRSKNGRHKRHTSRKRRPKEVIFPGKDTNYNSSGRSGGWEAGGGGASKKKPKKARSKHLTT